MRDAADTHARHVCRRFVAWIRPLPVAPHLRSADAELLQRASRSRLDMACCGLSTPSSTIPAKLSCTRAVQPARVGHPPREPSCPMGLGPMIEGHGAGRACHVLHVGQRSSFSRVGETAFISFTAPGILVFYPEWRFPSCLLNCIWRLIRLHPYPPYWRGSCVLSGSAISSPFIIIIASVGSVFGESLVCHVLNQGSWSGSIILMS